jgi:hypothetical protein
MCICVYNHGDDHGHAMRLEPASDGALCTPIHTDTCACTLYMYMHHCGGDDKLGGNQLPLLPPPPRHVHDTCLQRGQLFRGGTFITPPLSPGGSEAVDHLFCKEGGARTEDGGNLSQFPLFPLFDVQGRSSHTTRCDAGTRPPLVPCTMPKPVSFPFVDQLKSHTMKPAAAASASLALLGTNPWRHASLPGENK